MQHENEKKRGFKGNQYTGEPQNEAKQKSAQKIAEKHGVSRSTIERDAVFATGITKVKKHAPELAETLLKGGLPVKNLISFRLSVIGNNMHWEGKTMSGFKTRLEKIIQSEHAPFGCKLKKTTLRWIKKEKVRTGKTASEIIEQAIKAYIDSTTAIEDGFGDTA